jgi:hypothetical protein
MHRRWLTPVLATLLAAWSAAPVAANAACRRLADADPAGTAALMPVCPRVALDLKRVGAASPAIEGPIMGGRRNRPTVSGTAFDLAEVGYEVEEFFLTGTATAYRDVIPLGLDGRWRVEPAATAPYKTRIVVYRPSDPARFSGTVVVEWLNVSGGLDAAPEWITLHTELTRTGAVWVGMSAQYVGIEAGASPLTALAGGLKSTDPLRYGTLSHPGDSFSYDIYSQAGSALRDPNGPDPLGGLRVRKLIAAGESQSAFRLTTYVNAVDRLARVYDGFYIHSRGGGSAPLSQEPLAQIGTPDVVRFRTDARVPILNFQTETDVIGLDSFPDRQEDSRNFRLWEAAGTAHADTYTLNVGFSDVGGDPSVAAVWVTASPLPGIIDCASPINSGPQHWIGKAAFRALERWVGGGVGPKRAPRLMVARDGDGEPEFVLDEDGNVIGGIRTSYVDAPVAMLSGLGQTGSSFCRIFGTTVPFSDEKIRQRWRSNAEYVADVKYSNDAAVRRGFLLEPDADLILEYARTSGIGD